MLHSENKKISAFIHELETAAVDTAVCENIYNRKVNVVAADNLAMYLSFMNSQNPSLLLVGEAPGTHGCARTGIPFTDEDSLMKRLMPLTGLTFHVMAKAYLEKEQSAQVIWEALRLSRLPLMWNIYPFHPHKSGNPNTNRTPSRGEIDMGKCYLFKLMALFPGIKPIAVGKKAEKALRQGGVDATYIRHPAHGGKAQCQDKLRQIQESLSAKVL